MSTIVIGVDSGDSSTRAVRFAARAARDSSTTLLIAHVVNWSPFTFTTLADNEDRSRKKAEELAWAEENVIGPMVEIAKESDLNVEHLIRHGAPARSLVEIALSHDAEQLVVGRTGDSGFSEAVFGSVVGRLAQSSPIPVTVVP